MVKISRKNLINTLSSSILVLSLSGCGILPYEEEFICNKGLNTGNCQSVSENYYDTFVNRDEIPLTNKKKEIFIEQVEEQDIIDNNWLSKDKVLDWSIVSTFNRPRLIYLIEVYDFDNNTIERLKKMISNNDNIDYTLNDETNQESTSSFKKTNSNTNTDELLHYMRLQNEELHEKIANMKYNKKD